MGLVGTIVSPLLDRLEGVSLPLLVLLSLLVFLALAVIVNVLRQLLFKDPNEPPLVFHWFPVIGSTVTYGIDPYKFFFSCREKVSTSL